MIAKGLIGSLFQRSATAAAQGIGPLQSAEGRAQGQERQRGKIFNTKCINNRFRGAGYGGTVSVPISSLSHSRARYWFPL
ncbi:hypothetical protein ATO46_16555 [Aeromonas schubertii]|nr:hypothetical protein ATO46_16555 [Aeromonas schubertii]